MTVTNPLLKTSTWMIFCRHLHTNQVGFAAVSTVEKSVLAKLRKTTGYSFSRCKEALEKHNSDLKEAEKWLRSEAQTHGWEKATKLQGRATAQGLVSVLASPNNAVILEMNCETDFVARNKKFQSLVQRITQGCFALSASKGKEQSPSSVFKHPLDHTGVANVPLEDTIAKDEIALSIGDIGENIQARRALCMHSSEPVLLAGYTHPAHPEAEKQIVQYGKFGAIVAFKSVGKAMEKSQLTTSEIGRQLCQHIVGMNPVEIGSMEPPPPKPVKVNKEPEPEVKAEEGGQGSEEATDIKMEITTVPEIDETVLLNQEFLLDPELTVRDFLIQNSIEVVDFVRFECGENLDPK